MEEDVKKACEVIVHSDTQYEIVNGRMNLIGRGWKSNINHCLELHKDTELFLYSQGWNVLADSDATKISHGVIRFSTPADFKPNVGNILTIRDIIPDQVGMFIFESSNITRNRVNMHYMYGLGVLSIAAIIVITIVAGVNYTQKSNDDLSELLLSNTDALANTEATACENGTHCTQQERQKCYYYTINGDGNKFITHYENQIHNEQD